MQGWLKLHRKILQSEIFENEKLLKIFIYCLTKSSHKNTESRVGRQKVQLKPGQFIFGRKKAALELNMKESTVRDYFEILEEDGVISIDSTNKYSVITVDNWAIYQSNDEEYDHKTTPDNQQNNSNLPSERQQKDTYKNGRELKEVKNVKEFITTTTAEQMECPIQFYKNNIGAIRPKISEEIANWSEDLGEPLILEAMRRSLDRNKPTWGYVKSILQSWINKGIRTIEQAEAEEVEYKNKKIRNGPATKSSSRKEVIPEWFNDREEQEKQDINKQPSIDDTARTIELAIKLKRSRENILDSINDRFNLSEEDIASIKEGKCSAKEVLLEQLKPRVAGGAINMGGGKLKSNKKHFAYYDISSHADNVKTFEGKRYNVHGIWAVDRHGNAEKLSSIYYRIRTVKDRQFRTIAKRKNPMSELKPVK